jgi:hypothetical protein
MLMNLMMFGLATPVKKRLTNSSLLIMMCTISEPQIILWNAAIDTVVWSMYIYLFFFKINKYLLPLIKLVSLIRTLCEVYFDRICWVKFVFTCVMPAVLTVTSTNKTKIFLKVSFNTNKLHMALYCSPMTSISMNLTKINYFIAY